MTDHSADPRRARSLPRRGIDLLQDPRFNKGTGFTEAERDVLKIRGLVPPGFFAQEEQLARIMSTFRQKRSYSPVAARLLLWSMAGKRL